MLEQTINYIPNALDVPIYAMVLLGIVPTIATIVSFARHVIGFKSFSVYVPIITTIVFLELGIVYGIAIACAVFLVTIFTRRILHKYRMHYFFRISFIYTIVCFILFALLVALTALNLGHLIDFRPLFPVILLITVVEEYFNNVVKEGENRVTVMFLETLAISVISYFVISSTFFTKIMVDNIWLLLFLFPINILLARWEGLRFSEIARFKGVIGNEMKKLEDEEEESKKKKKKKKKDRQDPDKENGSQPTKSLKSLIW